MADTIILDMNHPAVQHLCKKDKRLAKVISMVGTITYEPHDDGYSFIVHEIIEQMLSIKAGAKIFNRLSDLCNGNICPASINALSEADICSTGTSKAKAKYIKNITDAVISAEIVLDDLQSMDDLTVIKKLTSLKGIGNWTAKMYLIFVLNRPDILPFEDGAFLQSYKWLYKTEDISAKSISKKCSKWKPYSSIAARYLYRALDNRLTKQEFHLYKEN